MEAFKPGTGPADSYWVIGLGSLENEERAREISPQASDAILSGSGGGPLLTLNLYSRRGPALWSAPFFQLHQWILTAMRAETEMLVDEIKQAISLLRRHL